MAKAYSELADALVLAHHRRLERSAASRLGRASSLSRASAPVYFLHVSKSGGTSVCDLAYDEVNGCSPPSKDHDGFSAHCWTQGTGPAWESGAERRHMDLSCNETVDVFRRTKSSLVFNEGYLPAADPGGGGAAAVGRPQLSGSLCNEQLIHATVLRNPYKRVESHAHLLDVRKEAGDWGTRLWGDLSFKEKAKANPYIFDNYITRVLLGHATYYSAGGSGSLGDDHLRAGQLQLMRFDVVATLEHACGWQHLWSRALLWPSTDLDAHAKRRRVKKKVIKQGRETDWDLIMRHNAIDYQLWRLGGVISSIDHAIFGLSSLSPPSRLRTC